MLAKEGNQLEEFHDGAGPAVREEERRGVGTAVRLVDEMQLDAAQACRELTKAVYARFLGAPVEAIAPVRYKLAQVVAARAGRPHGERRLVRKARAREALAQVGEQCFGNMQDEGANMGNCAANREGAA